jgi:hypothetical protein
MARVETQPSAIFWGGSVQMVRAVKVLMFALVLSALFGTALKANTINSASCSSADVQTAINQAKTGDTVLIPGGSCTWSAVVTLNTAITLNGQGKTTITWAGGGQLSVGANGSANTFVTGFTFLGSFNNGGCPISFHTSFSPQSKTFRFYKNTLDDGNPANQGTLLCVDGTGPGLIDHNSFTTHHGADEVIHNLGQGPSDSSGWTTDVTPGGPNMIFIEDNAFTFLATGNPAYFWGSSAVQAYYGARTVFRHNTVEMMQVDQHGTCGSIDARWWEIYNNTFTTNAANASQSHYMALRGGSGVAFNNQHTGTNQVTGAIEVTEDCTSGTYPLANQLGRGINQGLSPAYIWGNGADMHIYSGNSTFVQQGRDYYLSSTQPSLMSILQTLTNTLSSAYTPYTYPHPLTVSTQSAGPAAPSNLAAVVQ